MLGSTAASVWFLSLCFPFQQPVGPTASVVTHELDDINDGPAGVMLSGSWEWAARKPVRLWPDFADGGGLVLELPTGTDDLAAMVLSGSWVQAGRKPEYLQGCFAHGWGSVVKPLPSLCFIKLMCWQLRENDANPFYERKWLQNELTCGHQESKSSDLIRLHSSFTCIFQSKKDTSN